MHYEPPAVNNADVAAVDLRSHTDAINVEPTKREGKRIILPDPVSELPKGVVDDAGWTSSVATPTIDNRVKRKTEGNLGDCACDAVVEEIISPPQQVSNASPACGMETKQETTPHTETHDASNEIDRIDIELPTEIEPKDDIDDVSTAASIAFEKADEKDDIFDVSLGSAVSYYATATTAFLHSASVAASDATTGLATTAQAKLDEAKKNFEEAQKKIDVSDFLLSCFGGDDSTTLQLETAPEISPLPAATIGTNNSNNTETKQISLDVQSSLDVVVSWLGDDETTYKEISERRKHGDLRYTRRQNESEEVCIHLDKKVFHSEKDKQEYLEFQRWRMRKEGSTTAVQDHKDWNCFRNEKEERRNGESEYNIDELLPSSRLLKHVPAQSAYLPELGPMKPSAVRLGGIFRKRSIKKIGVKQSTPFQGIFPSMGRDQRPMCRKAGSNMMVSNPPPRRQAGAARPASAHQKLRLRSE